MSVLFLQADAAHLPLADKSVQCCVTSPPYWGLRDYGLGRDALGLEPTPELYVAHMMEVFREVRRVLRDDGTLWLNLGDSYTSNGGHSDQAINQRRGGYNLGNRPEHEHREFRVRGLKPKDLVGIPWRVAFALQADGWYLRSDIIWSKPNPMPESVTDRPTKSHEYIFLLAKSERYFWDAKAVQEPVSGTAHTRGNGVNPKAGGNTSWAKGPGRHDQYLTGRPPRVKQNESFSAAVTDLVYARNIRTVWTIATQPYPEAHYATFPEALVRPCILAGCPEGGTVLDPFGGSGTVGRVAEALGRNAIHVDLKYHHLAVKRHNSLAPLFLAGAAQ